MPWLVDVDLVGSHARIEKPTHKAAQHEAALIAREYRDEGREVLGTNKDDFYVVEAEDPANVITITIKSIS